MGGVVDLLYGLRHTFERAQPPVWVPDPRLGDVIHQEFRTPNNGSAFDGGSQYFTSGGGANSFFAAEPGHPGILLQTVTAVADVAAALSFVGVGGGLNNFDLAGGPCYFEALLRIPTLSDGVNNFHIRAGLLDQTGAGDETDAVAFENDRQVNGSNNWFMLTATNGVRTRTDLGVAPTANAWTRLRINLDAQATLASFVVDGVPRGSQGANIPTGGGRQLGAGVRSQKTLGAGASLNHFDYYRFRQDFGSPR